MPPPPPPPPPPPLPPPLRHHRFALMPSSNLYAAGSCSGNERTFLSASWKQMYQTNQQAEKVIPDRLSELPDPLIVSILSCLSFKEAARTCLLSKRWQFVWTNLSRLELKEKSNCPERVRKFVAWVNRILGIFSGNYLEKFEVGIEGKDSDLASDVNTWVQFALKNKVENFGLELHSVNYTVPQIMFSSSFTSLRIRSCVLGPQGPVEWLSLKILHLEEVDLHQDAIAKILAGCPVLYHLALKSFWGLNCLEIDSKSLHELVIKDCLDNIFTGNVYFQISAPYIHFLDYSQSPLGSFIRVENISSVVEAHIDFPEFAYESALADDWMGCSQDLFENLQHVKKLVMGPDCIELLSMLVVKGWQLPKSRREILTVSAQGTESIPGIIGLLESSPYLESLVINGMERPRKAHLAYDVTASYLPKDDLSFDLLLLKTVTISTFTVPGHAGERVLKVVRLLLKRAKVLEKMVIKVERIRHYFPVDYMRLAQTLLSYPRLSTKAVVQFS